MREIFQQDLEQVGDDLVTMAKFVQQAVTDASTALFSRDLLLAERVISSDAELDRMQDELDQRCVTLLARQSPVATDLRIVITGLRLSATLERMGDLARHVAEIARGRYPEDAIPAEGLEVFTQFTAAAVKVSGDVVELLEGRDVNLAYRVLEDDAELDRLHAETFRLMLAPSADVTGLSPQQIVDITLLGRFLERFGDHGTAVAKRILFLVTGDAHPRETAAR